MSGAWANGILIAMVVFGVLVVVAFAVATAYADRGRR